MSILDFLKKIRLPSFENDFMRDLDEDAMNDASFSIGAKIIETPQCDQEELPAQNSLREWMEDEWERHSDPSDPASITYIDPWEE